MKFTNRIALLLIFCATLSVYVEGKFDYSYDKRDIVEENLSQFEETGSCCYCDFTDASSSQFRKVLQNVLDKYKKGEIIEVDLSNSNLAYKNLSGFDLKDVILLRANLTGANLSKNSVPDADLSDEIDLVQRNLLQLAEKGYCYHCDFRSVSPEVFRKFIEIALDNKKKGKFKYICLIKCNLAHKDLSGLDLNGAILRHSNLSGVNLSNCSLFNADLSESLLEGVNASDAHMDEMVASGSCWYNSKFTKASCNKAIFRNADLRFCKVCDAQFNGADLSDAEMDDLEWYEYASFQNVTNFPQGRAVCDEIKYQNSFLGKMLNNDIPADY